MFLSFSKEECEALREILQHICLLYPRTLHAVQNDSICEPAYKRLKTSHLLTNAYIPSDDTQCQSFKKKVFLTKSTKNPVTTTILAPPLLRTVVEHDLNSQFNNDYEEEKSTTAGIITANETINQHSELSCDLLSPPSLPCPHLPSFTSDTSSEKIITTPPIDYSLSDDNNDDTVIIENGVAGDIEDHEVILVLEHNNNNNKQENESQEPNSLQDNQNIHIEEEEEEEQQNELLLNLPSTESCSMVDLLLETSGNGIDEGINPSVEEEEKEDKNNKHVILPTSPNNKKKKISKLKYGILPDDKINQHEETLHHQSFAEAAQAIIGSYSNAKKSLLSNSQPNLEHKRQKGEKQVIHHLGHEQTKIITTKVKELTTLHEKLKCLYNGILERNKNIKKRSQAKIALKHAAHLLGVIRRRLVEEKVRIRKQIGMDWFEGFLSHIEVIKNSKNQSILCYFIIHDDGDRKHFEENDFLKALYNVNSNKAKELEKAIQFHIEATNNFNTICNESPFIKRSVQSKQLQLANKYLNDFKQWIQFTQHVLRPEEKKILDDRKAPIELLVNKIQKILISTDPTVSTTTTNETTGDSSKHNNLISQQNQTQLLSSSVTSPLFIRENQKPTTTTTTTRAFSRTDSLPKRSLSQPCSLNKIKNKKSADVISNDYRKLRHSQSPQQQDQHDFVSELLDRGSKNKNLFKQKNNNILPPPIHITETLKTPNIASLSKDSRNRFHSTGNNSITNDRHDIKNSSFENPKLMTSLGNSQINNFESTKIKNISDVDAHSILKSNPLFQPDVSLWRLPYFIDCFKSSKLRIILKPAGLTLESPTRNNTTEEEKKKKDMLKHFEDKQHRKFEEEEDEEHISVKFWWDFQGETTPFNKKQFYTSLDLKESGIVLAAAGQSMPMFLDLIIKYGRIEHDFIALVFGDVPPGVLYNDRRIELKSLPNQRKRSRISIDGSPALTLITRIASFERIENNNSTTTTANSYTLVWGRMFGGAPEQLFLHLRGLRYQVVGISSKDSTQFTCQDYLTERRLIHIQSIHIDSQAASDRSSFKLTSQLQRDWHCPCPIDFINALSTLTLKDVWAPCSVMEIIGFNSVEPALLRSSSDVRLGSVGCFRTLIQPSLTVLQNVLNNPEIHCSISSKSEGSKVFCIKGLYVPLPSSIVLNSEMISLTPSCKKKKNFKAYESFGFKNEELSYAANKAMRRYLSEVQRQITFTPLNYS